MRFNADHDALPNPRPKAVPTGALNLTDFVVVIDTREQSPFGFTGIKPDKRQDASKVGEPLLVQTKVAMLATGDYSVEGLENEITIERKSIVDLFATVIMDRERFIRELERMRSFRFASIVIEGDLHRIAEGIPSSGLAPKSVLRSIMGLAIDFPHVQWVPCPSRRFAEVWTFRTLEMYTRKLPPEFSFDSSAGSWSFNAAGGEAREGTKVHGRS